MSTLVGKTLLNRYNVREFLGRGAMAEVYKVWDSERAVHLAMKVMHADLAEDKIFLRRFKREANNLAQLQHPHIVRFYGLEQDQFLVFMLMDFVEGMSLKTRIFRKGAPFTSVEAKEILKPLTSALHFAHNRGLVHCDIKPANIMLDKHGEVRLADFGIARMSDTATATLVGAGTPAYMSPEQIRGEDPTPQSDIYALGIVLYEMLTGGERPFIGEQATVTGSTGEKVRWEQMNLLPLSPRLHNPDISPELESVILKSLEKDPAKRYQSALDFFNAFELATGIRQEAPRAPVGALPSPQQKKEVVKPVSEPKSKLRPDRFSKPVRSDSPKKWLPAADIALIAFLLLGFGWLMGGGSAQIFSANAPTRLSTIIYIATSTNTLAPTSTIVSSITPSPTPTSFPTQVHSSLVIPSTSQGVQFQANVSGVYRFTIENGAIQNCPPGADPTNSWCGTWSSYLLAFKNRGIEWSPNPINWDYFIGDNSPFDSKSEAIKKNAGKYLDIPLYANEYVLFVPFDCKDCYHDNLGEMKINVYIVGNLNIQQSEDETATLTSTLGIGSTMTSKKDGMVMVYVPEGEFQMGSEDSSDEKPIHTVYLDAFWMDQTEVTNEMFAKFLNVEGNQSEGGVDWLDAYSDYALIVENGSIWQPVSGYENHPVAEVSWYGAQAYCEWAGKHLPSEAEWEKAARGNLTDKKYPWGDADPTCSASAENGAQIGACSGFTTSVKSFAPNDYGLYDMAGNVWEWTADWYDSDYYANSPSSNPLGPETGSAKVLRGGSWDINFNYLRAAYRVWVVPDDANYNFGFRCSLSLP